MIDPNSQTQTAESAPTSGPLVTPLKTGLNPSEAAQMAEWTKDDLTKGKITAQQAESIFNDLSTPAEQRLPDTRTEEQKMLDKQFPVPRESDYTIRYVRPGEDAKETPELKAFDANARTWLAGAGFPRDTGNSLVNAITKTIQHTREMTPEQLEQYGTAEFAKLQRAHGPALEERLQAAARMVDDLERKTPGLKQLLKSRGVGDNALVVNALLTHAQIYHARQGR